MLRQVSNAAYGIAPSPPVVFWAACMAIYLVFAGEMPASAKVIVKEKTIHFSVSGNNGEEIYKSLLLEGQKAASKRDAIAAMGREIDLTDGEAEITNGRCIVTRVDIVLRLTFFLPKLRPAGKTSQQTRRAWKNLYDELEKHERQHARIQLEGIEEVERQIKRISGTAVFGCRDYVPMLMMRLYPVILRIEQRHAAFDRADSRSTSKATRLQFELIKAK